MNPIFSQKLTGDAEFSRIEILFDRLPASVVAALIGIFLSFVVLFDTIGPTILKGWAAYMLSLLAVRVWIWYMFGKTGRHSEHIHRWEWLVAGGAFFTGIGWGALFGPLYPPSTHPDAQMFVALLVVVVAFTGSVFLAPSNITFWLFIIPTLLPAVVHYTSSALSGQVQWPITTAAGCLAVLILVQHTLYRSATERLQRSADAEALLAEQQAIFKSSPMGIAVIDNKQIVKCNARLGELLGRRIQELTSSSLHDHFASAAEADLFLADSTKALKKEHLAQGMYRLRRADDSEFWAEFSGRKLAGGVTNAVWTIADVTTRVAKERRAPVSGAYNKATRR
ncbi:MAG: PAS domain S-box protein [Sulfuritalea sp.]|nr:PAS domain S-box protein [Sulfuritalea sp.]